MLRYRFTNYLFVCLFSLVIVGFFSLSFPCDLNAASIGVYPSTPSVTVGNIVSVKVIVSTESKFINNTEGVLSYPTDLLEPISISKSSSIFNLWVEEPKFNSGGSVSFNGGLPTPGYNGSSGEVVTVVFKAKKTGTASLIFSDSAIRENDGLGTNVLNGYKNGSIIITEAPKSPELPGDIQGEVFSVRVETVNSRNVTQFFPKSLIPKIDSFLIQVDNSTPFTIKASDIEDNKYILPVQNKGDHLLMVYAYDKAGNSSKAEIRFNSPVISPPKLKAIPEVIYRGDSVLVKGETIYPFSKVDILIQTENSDKKTYQVKTLKDGTFSFNSKEINSTGFVYISGQLVFSEQVKSAFSDPVMVKVEDSIVVKTSKSFIYTLGFLIPVIILILILLLLVYFGWHKFFGLRQELKKETEEIAQDIHKAMDSFKSELVDQLDKLEKVKEDRELNKKEEKIFKDLEGSVDRIDDFINKKIKKILK